MPYSAFAGSPSNATASERRTLRWSSATVVRLGRTTIAYSSARKASFARSGPSVAVTLSRTACQRPLEVRLASSVRVGPNTALMAGPSAPKADF